MEKASSAAKSKWRKFDHESVKLTEKCHTARKKGPNKGLFELIRSEVSEVE